LIQTELEGGVRLKMETLFSRIEIWLKKIIDGPQTLRMAN
jgi:hypothetical protein